MQRLIKWGITAKITVVFALLILVGTITTGYMVYHGSRQQLLEHANKQLSHSAELIKIRFQDSINALNNDILMLSYLPKIQQLAEQTTSPTLSLAQKTQLQKEITSSFNALLAVRPFYFQARYIGVADQGREVIRIDRDMESGALITIPPKELQQKGKRDYFIASLQLQKGETYLSPINLNREHGQISLPVTPTIRISTPIYLKGGELAGIIIINVNFQYAFNVMAEMTPKTTKLYFANQQGDYLVHPEVKKIFGFDWGRHYSMYEDFPQSKPLFSYNNKQVKQLLNTATSSSTIFTQVPIQIANYQRHYVIAMQAPHDVILAGVQEVRNYTILVILLFCSGGILLSIVFSYFLTRPLSEISTAIGTFNNQQTLPKLPIDRVDEIGVLARSFHKLIIKIRSYIQDIEEKEQEVRAIFETASQSIIVTSHQGIIEQCNIATEYMFGYTQTELLQQPIGLLFAGKKIQTQHLLDKCHSHNHEIMGKRKDSSSFPIYVSVGSYQLIDKQKFTFIFHDISDLKNIEAEVRKAKETAEAANHAKSIFLANMSHELRTPLNAILGFTQIMERDAALSLEQKENIQIINQSGEHLLTLINDVLEMSKIEAGRTQLHENVFSLPQLFKELKNLFYLRAEIKGLQLIFTGDADSDVHYIKADEGKIRQILINLLGNALKFTHEGSVTVHLHQVKHLEGHTIQLHISIIDTGAGMSESEIEQLFQPFTQTQSGIKAQEGTGLGLSITQQFIKLMGGGIQVESRIGQGTSFTFYINVKRAAAPTENKHLTNQRQVIGLVEGQTSPRILIAEDDTLNRRLLNKILSDVGFDVRDAKDGGEAVQLFQTWQPDFIWMDMRMPVLNGYEATKQIKKLPNGDKTIIIALTASAFDEERELILAAGCDDFMRKPFKTAKLFEKMAHHLNISYQYEEIDETKQHIDNTEESLSLTPEVMAKLPLEWMSQLELAVIQADFSQLLALIGDIEAEYPEITEKLSCLVNEFEYDTLLILIQKSELCR